MSLAANIRGNQSYQAVPWNTGAFPNSRAVAEFTGPFGVGQGFIKNGGTISMGPGGLSTEVSFAPGYFATPANTANGLGLASPFATTNNYLDQIGQNSFGMNNPYSPLYGTPYDVPNSVLALGSFGGYQDAFSPYSGSGVPSLDNGFGSFGPTGGVPGFGGAPGGFGGVPGFGGAPGGFAGAPGFGGAPGGFGGPSGFGGANAFAGAPGGFGGPSGFPRPGGGGVPAQSFPNLYNNPAIFGRVPNNVIPGIGQSFVQRGGGFQNNVNLVEDGVGRLLLQSQADPNTPVTTRGAGGYLRTPFGIFETGVGWLGGNANAGILGAQASGMAWAKVRSAVNPAIITGYANPFYNNYNFNQGFTNA